MDAKIAEHSSYDFNTYCTPRGSWVSSQRWQIITSQSKGQVYGQELMDDAKMAARSGFNFNAKLGVQG